MQSKLMTLSLQFDLTQEKNLLQIDFPWHFIFGNSYFLPSPLSYLSPTFFKKSESKSHQSVTIVTSTIEYSLQVSKLDFFPPCDIKDSLLVTDKIWQYSKQWAKSCAKMVYLIISYSFMVPLGDIFSTVESTLFKDLLY